jgi:bifunctional polynucleotide phosphatase/kinase
MTEIYNINNADYREKMASFDYDWTIVNPKDGKTFPSNINDWQWLYPDVPNKIKKYYEDGYMIVIFTNQSKTWKYEQIKLVIKTLEIPVFIVIATEKINYKPNLNLFTTFIKNNKIDKDKSFFIGDALGRKTDFSDSDKIFAENIGIPWFPPENIFNKEIKEINISLDIFSLSNDNEIIIIMGYPGSGKSTIAKKICENEKYIHIEGDVYKTSSNMIKKSLDYILQKKSIVFDATNSSIKKRKEYIDLAKKYNYKIKCIHISTSLDISYKQNLNRDDTKKVPKIAFSVYSKYYEEPNESEGFILYTV